VWQALLTSRLVVWIAGVFGFLQIGAAQGATSGYDPTNLTAPFSSFLANAAVAPLARWDSVWYLTIARSGYSGNPDRMPFFPLYPLAIHALGWITGSELMAGVVISLVAFAVALLLLRRLIALDYAAEVADATVLLVAFCPMALFFSAVYTEALFLAFSVGAIYAARRERWWLAGVLGFLAAMSRNGGVALVLPLAVIYLYGPRLPSAAGVRRTRWAPDSPSGPGRLRPPYRLRADAAWLALVPAGLGVYLAYLGLQYGQGLAPFQSEAFWYRQTTFPLTTIVRSASQAWDGVRQLFQGPTYPLRVPSYAASVTGAAAEDICLFAFLLLGLAALIGVFRRQQPAYWLYALALMVLALSDPVKLQPLASLPRYEMVVFPFFLWAAERLTARGWLNPVLALSAVLLGLFTVEFATWRWLA
jgi:hypothetical protein